jgi:hypothetical protein
VTVKIVKSDTPEERQNPSGTKAQTAYIVVIVDTYNTLLTGGGSHSSFIARASGPKILIAI